MRSRLSDTLCVHPTRPRVWHAGNPYLLPGIKSFVDSFVRDRLLTPLTFPDGFTYDLATRSVATQERPVGLLEVTLEEATGVPRMDTFGKVRDVLWGGGHRWLVGVTFAQLTFLAARAAVRPVLFHLAEGVAQVTDDDQKPDFEAALA